MYVASKPISGCVAPLDYWAGVLTLPLRRHADEPTSTEAMEFLEGTRQSSPQDSSLALCRGLAKDFTPQLEVREA